MADSDAASSAWVEVVTDSAVAAPIWAPTEINSREPAVNCELATRLAAPARTEVNPADSMLVAVIVTAAAMSCRAVSDSDVFADR